MTEPISTQQPPQPFSKDQVEMLKFLREEAEANRIAQREESDLNRKLFLDTSKIVAIPLAVLLTLAGIFFYRDVNTMKEAMKTEGEAEARAEIKRMDANIDQTLEDRFKSDNIQNTIQQAALEAATKQAPGLINQVITPEVRKAVQSQIGTIRSVATEAATNEVHGALDPVVADVKLQAVIAKATSDDARSFDELLAFKNSHTGTPSQKALVNRVIENLDQHTQEGSLASGNYADCPDVSGNTYRAQLTSPIESVRSNAIGACIRYIIMGQSVPKVPGNSESAFTVMETIAPLWVKVVTDDPSLSIRTATVRALNLLFDGGPDVPQGGFDLIDTTNLKKWWTNHEADQAAIALVAYANDLGDLRSSGARLDEIGLYDEIDRLANTRAAGSAMLEHLRANMRSGAATPRLSPPDLAHEMGRDCTGVQQDLGIRLKGFARQLEQERFDGYALLELQYLQQNCSVTGESLTRIAEYGAVTLLLSSRYAAAKIVNHSSGSSLDPYQSQPLREWVKSHQ
jgi:hypothetical protein